MSIIRLKPIAEQIIKEYEGAQDLSKRRSIWIGMNEAWEELRTRFSEACEIYSKGQTWGLYRGYNTAKHKEKSINDMFFIDPKKSIRTSKETNNFYTYWISTSPLWKDYPPRNKSVIGSFNKNVASDYGPLIFLLVPINGARFSIVENRDAWGAFSHAESFFQLEPGDVALDSMSYEIAKFFSIASIVLNLTTIQTDIPTDESPVYELMDKDPEEFLHKIEPHRKDIIDNIEEIKNHIKNLTSISSKRKLTIFADRIQQHQHLSSFEKMFDYMYSPKENKVNLVNGIKSLYEKYDYSDYEFWTDAECLLIPTKFRDPNDNIFRRVMRGESPPND